MLSIQKVSDWTPPDIKDFNPSITDDSPKPVSYSDDITLSHYVASNRTWAGEQRKGAHYNITCAISRTDHVERAMLEPFHLAGEIPIPPDVTRAIDFISPTPDRSIRKFWNIQLSRLKSLVKGGADTQLSWDSCRPQSVADAQSPIRTVSIAQLLALLGVGGDKWLKQFIYGFDIIGRLSQRGEFPADPKVKCPGDISTIFDTCRSRFVTRARNSGYKYADSLWQEALAQVNAGWLDPPCPFNESGTIINADVEGANVAFRFAVVRPDKIRACGDLKYGLVSRCCAADTPIMLPTWDHIGQLCLRIRHTDRPWAFFKADHKAAYKNSP